MCAVAYGSSFTPSVDIAGMLQVSNDIIDRAYIKTWAEKLDLLEIWNQLDQRVPRE